MINLKVVLSEWLRHFSRLLLFLRGAAAWWQKFFEVHRHRWILRLRVIRFLELVLPALSVAVPRFVVFVMLLVASLLVVLVGPLPHRSSANIAAARAPHRSG